MEKEKQKEKQTEVTEIHLEFESDAVTDDDLRRFREYEAATSRTFHVAVICNLFLKGKAAEGGTG